LEQVCGVRWKIQHMDVVFDTPSRIRNKNKNLQMNMTCIFGKAVAVHLQVKSIHLMMGVVTINNQQRRSGMFVCHQMTDNINKQVGHK
jgi:hypothetical protein